MPHVLIAGITESGKTTLAVKLAGIYKARGVPVVVCDPLMDNRWNADLVTRNAERFLHAVKQRRSCAVFIDESGEVIGQYNDQMFWLATRARHYGHNVHFITQRVQQIAPTVRGQCTHLFLFHIGVGDAKMLAAEFAKPEIVEAASFQRGEYLYTTRYGGLQRCNLPLNGVG